MRYLLGMAFLVVGMVGVGSIAIADEAQAPTVNASQQVENVDADFVPLRHCELRCVVTNAFGRCIQWRRVCW